MGTRMVVTADLEFAVDLDDGQTARGTLRGAGADLELWVDRPELFAGGRDAAAVRGFADALAASGLRLHVVAENRQPLVSLGSVRAPWWQRRATRSRHMRIGGMRGGLTALAGRSRRRAGILPAAGLWPPGTPYPLVPTLQRRPRRNVTTTHDPSQGGGPRLVAVPGDGIWRPELPTYWLQKPVTTIGSDPANDVVLAGLMPRHAEVRHTDDDEYVVVSVEGGTRVHGRPVHEQLLRTSARIEVGHRILAYYREEWADHGRPYGGRIGGELGHQRTQPPREVLAAEETGGGERS
ncbi:FHA domain-containing protein [Nocardioides sp.]|uniref:FHA domain-containing protein n=1 Tax=Nocardioides sp. TaxID=35761 RepID=UPI002737037C|nr:FHA domain-containing protein [Nocardioides sp.]MDP3894447.1 FHA domain-containing protein [Nocardioides sp.]